MRTWKNNQEIEERFICTVIFLQLVSLVLLPADGMIVDFIPQLGMEKEEFKLSKGLHPKMTQLFCSPTCHQTF